MTQTCVVYATPMYIQMEVNAALRNLHNMARVKDIKLSNFEDYIVALIIYEE